MAKSISLSAFSTGSGRRIYKYTKATDTFSANISSDTGYDLFDDSFAVDDAIYFAQNYYQDAPILAIRFDIATAMAATSYTLVWEYYANTTDEWKELPLQADDTYSFSTVGRNEVWFHMPDDCYHATFNSVLSKWVRVRVSAVDTPTEGGAIGSNATDSREALVEISGGTSGDPITLDDIEDDADIINYKLLERQTSTGSIVRVHFFISHVQIKQTDDGYFKMNSTGVFFTFGYISGSGTFNFGEASGNYWRYGCYLSYHHNSSIIWGSTGGSTINAYNTRFEGRRGQFIGHSTDFNLFGCQVTGGYSISPLYGGKELNYTDCIIDHVNTYTAPATYAPNIIRGVYQQMQAYQTRDGLIVREARVLGGVWVMWDTQFIDFACTGFSVVYSWNSTRPSEQPAYWYKHGSLDLTVQDRNGDPIVGATVHIEDVNGDVPQTWVGDLATGGFEDITDMTTDNDGNVSTDILHHTWKRIFYPSIVSTTTLYGPHAVTISKNGYAERTIQYTMDQKRVEVEMLERPVQSGMAVEADITEDTIMIDIAEDTITAAVAEDTITATVSEDTITATVTEDTITKEVS